MAFFEDLGKKLTNAGQATVQKTKELAEIAKLNSNISDEEKKIKNFYLEIGKLYVSLNADNCDPQYAEFVNGIKDCETKIAQLNADLIEVKGVRVCEKCGAEVKTDAAFCSGCGEKLPVIAKTDPVLAEEADNAEAVVEEEVVADTTEETVAGEVVEDSADAE